MNTDWLVIILKRFGKGFGMGFIASLLVFLAQNPLVDLGSWKPWLVAGITAALTGGLLAVEKLLQGYNPQ